MLSVPARAGEARRRLGETRPVPQPYHRSARAGPFSRTRQRSRSHFNQRSHTNNGVAMNIHVSLGPLVSLIAGILILVMPRLLNFIVAIYLIVIGLIGLFGLGASHF
jgi:hypothetical protein